jgi:hypothetical protein
MVSCISKMRPIVNIIKSVVLHKMIHRICFLMMLVWCAAFNSQAQSNIPLTFNRSNLWITTVNPTNWWSTNIVLTGSGVSQYVSNNILYLTVSGSGGIATNSLVYNFNTNQFVVLNQTNVHIKSGALFTNISLDIAYVGSMVLTNPLDVINGGSGLTNYGTNTILIGAGTNPPTKLALGTDGQVLKIASGVIGWGTDNNSGSGGSSGQRITNIIISATNAVGFDLAVNDVFKVMVLTNFNYFFTNATSLTNGRAYVYFQNDTNGGWALQSFRNAGGVLHTNTGVSMQTTTNGSALDVLEVIPGFYTTNLIAYWPQNLQPRVAFTNSLAAGGGGGGGGSGGTNLKTYSNPTYVYDPVNPLPWPIVATSITISAGGSWPAGTYLLNGGIESFSTVDGNQTLYNLLSFTASAGISGGVYTIDP